MQDQISENIAKVSNPCLDMWEQGMNQVIDPDFSRMPEKDMDLLYAYYKQGCRKNFDWLPYDHPDWERINYLRGN